MKESLKATVERGHQSVDVESRQRAEHEITGIINMNKRTNEQTNMSTDKTANCRTEHHK